MNKYFKQSDIINKATLKTIIKLLTVYAFKGIQAVVIILFLNNWCKLNKLEKFAQEIKQFEGQYLF